MKFVSAIQDETFQLAIQDFMHFCGSRILGLLIIYYTKWKNISRSTYYTSVAKLKNLMTTEQFQLFETHLSKKLQKEKATVSKTHETKLIRDRTKVKIKYKEISDTKLPSHICKCVKKNVNRKNRRLSKKTRLSSTRKKARSKIKGLIPKLDNIPENKLKNTSVDLSSKISELSPHHLYLFISENRLLQHLLYQIIQNLGLMCCSLLTG